MPRPNKPHWHAPRSCFRTRIDGKYCYFPRAIGRYDKPMMGDVPKAAWDHLNELLVEREGRATAGTDPNVFWLVELYLQWCEKARDAGELSDGQYEGHATHLGKFRLFEIEGRLIGTAKARTFNVEDLDDFFDAMKAEYSDHYVANLGKSIRAMFNWATRRVKERTPARILLVNPVTGYQFPRPPGAVRGYLDGQVARRFIRWAWARSRSRPAKQLARRFDRLFLLMIWFQRLTGSRPGEACDLRWDDIDWAAQKIVIPANRHKTGKKTRKDRIIHLTAPVTRLLRVVERLPDRHSVWVFTHRRGNNAVDRGQENAVAGEPWPDGSAASAKVREWREAAIEAKVKGVQGMGPTKLVAYLNRHAYVSDAISQGLTHEQTANLVGNSAEVVRKTYAHAIEEQDAARARQLVERGRPRKA
ncbi:MAG: tyrosine-type recombinase/integrase [Isosphaeraceae bacterium]|nr:tyrosine-type recombinase/integrase [Isosphaeraceae bacterium]